MTVPPNMLSFNFILCGANPPLCPCAFVGQVKDEGLLDSEEEDEEETTENDHSDEDVLGTVPKCAFFVALKHISHFV